MVYCWFHDNKPITNIINENDMKLEHGDIYIMSEKAVGNDWKKKNSYTLRHAAGSKKYIQLYVDISKKEEMFLDISKTIDNLLISMSSLNVGENQGQSIGSVEASELVIETFALLVGSSQMIAGRKRKTRKGRKSRKSKKKGHSKRRYRRKSKKHRKLTR